MHLLSLSLFALAPTTSPAMQSPPAMKKAKASACASPEHRQFDFWAGHWDVFATNGEKPIAKSTIEKLHGGCVIRETWAPLKGAGGTSVNNYDPEDQRWHQTWVNGTNSRVEFHGGRVGEAMVLTGFWPNSAGPGLHALVRMTFTPFPDGSVRQVGETSTDHGVTWQPSFDFIYRKAR